MSSTYISRIYVNEYLYNIHYTIYYIFQYQQKKTRTLQEVNVLLQRANRHSCRLQSSFCLSFVIFILGSENICNRNHRFEGGVNKRTAYSNQQSKLIRISYRKLVCKYSQSSHHFRCVLTLIDAVGGSSSLYI